MKTTTWKTGYVAPILVALLALLSPTAAQDISIDTAGRATGLIMPTPEEEAAFSKSHSRVKAVRLNALAIGRLNAERKAKGLAPIPEEAAVPLGQEIIGEPGDSAPDATSKAQDVAPSALPTYVDNSILPAFPPIGDQKQLGSCTTFATTYYQLTHEMGLYFGRDQDVNPPNYAIIFSPRWTYNFANYHNGQPNTGSSFSDNYDVLQKHGAVTWEQFPYDGVDYLSWDLDSAHWQEAISYRVEPVQIVDTKPGLDSIKALLANCHVLTFGTYISSWQFTTIKDDPSTAEDDPFVGLPIAYWVNGKYGAHAMTIVGYNDAIWTDINRNRVVDTGEKGAFRIANSWGTGWGESGFTWLAYDALNAVSSVSRGPSRNREAAFPWAFVVTPKGQDQTPTPGLTYASYEPKMLAVFTVNHAQRNQVGISLGIPDKPWWQPGVLNFKGGPYAFDGTSTACDGTFVFDFTDLVPTSGAGQLYYLRMTDNSLDSFVATLNGFSVVDPIANQGQQSPEVPLSANSDFVQASVQYVSGNQPPVAQFSADPFEGSAPLTVQFADNSYDPHDDVIVGWTWDFGDGDSSDDAPSVSHTYTSAGKFTVTLTVVNSLGAFSSASRLITVTGRPAAPTDLQASVSWKSIILTWVDNASNEDGFYVERSTVPANAGFTRIYTTGANRTTCVDKVGARRGTYYYRVQAFNNTTGTSA